MDAGVEGGVGGGGEASPPSVVVTDSTPCMVVKPAMDTPPDANAVEIAAAVPSSADVTSNSTTTEPSRIDVMKICPAVTPISAATSVLKLVSNVVRATEFSGMLDKSDANFSVAVTVRGGGVEGVDAGVEGGGGGVEGVEGVGGLPWIFIIISIVIIITNIPTTPPPNNTFLSIYIIHI